MEKVNGKTINIPTLLSQLLNNRTSWLTTMQQIYGISPRFCIFCNCFSYLRSFVTDAIATSSGDDCIRIFQEVIHNQTVLQIFDV